MNTTMSQDPQPIALLDLPPEILTSVFLFLPDKSILTCKRVNHYLEDLISSSVEVQYALHSSLTTLVDNPHSPFSAQERLAKLRSKECSWEEMTINFTKSIQIPFPTSGIYDLTGGVYLLGDTSLKVLHYVTLPSQPNQEIIWQKLRTEEMIIDMGLCVYEHDLLAVITT